MDIDGIATQLFRFATRAHPTQVWAALTRPELSARYLYGLAAESGWRPGEAVTFTGPAVVLSGEVLASEEPRRLSYTVRADAGQPATYVTWEILGAGAGSVVRLYVDEPGEPADLGTASDVESAWLHVVADLESVLGSLVNGPRPAGSSVSAPQEGTVGPPA